MNTIYQRVKNAPTPRDVMLVIASALDEIMYALEEPTVKQPDPWGDWNTAVADVPAGHTAVVPVYAKRDDTAIEVARAALATETDGEARLALEARLRLLEEDGGIVAPANEGARVSAEVTGNAITVDLPPASPARQQERYQFANQLSLHEFQSVPTMSPIEFFEAYAKGGPMWLYLSDRDAVMAMPDGFRIRMVNDIEQDSPAQAQEVARDILKDVSPGTSETVLDRTYQS